MPGQMFDRIREMYQSELHDDLKQLMSLVLSLIDGMAGADTGEILSLPQKYQSLIYYGDALFHTAEYKRAEGVFMRCLQIRKTLNKSKIKTVNSVELTSEVDVKYKIYLCLNKMKQSSEALSILESINTKKRSARVNLALAKLYLHEGRDRSAITCYKEVIREHPLALEALTSLLSLGMRGVELMSCIMSSIPPSSCEWLNTWVKAHAHVASKEYNQAITTFRAMESKHGLKDNVLILSNLGEACFHGGHYIQALAQFKRVHTLDPLYMKNMDIYAYLLAKEKKTEELHGLAQSLMSISEQPVESWIAMGYSSLYSPTLNKNKTIRAIYCAQKAYTLDNLSVQALVLKGAALLDIKKSQQAMQHFHEAIRMAPNRFEAYQGMIDCNMSNRRVKDALVWATRACKIIGINARTLTLAASVLAKDPKNDIVQKAKQYLNRAMAFDPNLLDPVYLMADILFQEQDYSGAAELLRKMLQNHSTTRLHQQLADCLANLNQHQEALDQYSISLSIDPNNVKAREASERVEKHNDTSYDVDAEELMNASDDGPDYSDGTWSETEFSQPW